jgi:large subunit ribosomal protein L17
MLRNQVKALFLYQRIRTTLARAKEVSKLADKLITIAKRNTLQARREVYVLLNDRDLVSLLFREIAPRFKGRKGGYTRILHLRNRIGDNARMAILELTERKLKEPLKPKEVKKKIVKEKPIAEEKSEPIPEEKPKPALEKKIPPKRPPKEKFPKRFLGGLRKLFKRERDSL